MATGFNIDWARIPVPQPIQPISPLSVSGPLTSFGQSSAPQGIDWSRIPTPTPPRPVAPIPRPSAQSPLEISISNVNTGYDTPEARPEVTLPAQRTPTSPPLISDYARPIAEAGLSKAKQGVGNFFGAVGTVLDVVDPNHTMRDAASGAAEWAVTPWAPDEEQYLINKAGELPFVGPGAKKLTEYIVGGSTAPLGLLGIAATGGAAKLGGKVLGYGASKVLNNFLKKAPEVHGPITMEDAFKAEVAAAKIGSEEEKAKVAKEMSRRVGEMTQVKAVGKGEAGLHEQLSKLGGSLPSVPMESIRHKFTNQNIVTLMDKIENSNLRPLEKIDAKKGLERMMDASFAGMPEASEIKLLQRVWPDLLVPEQKAGFVTELGNTFRTLQAGGDLTSFPLRQGSFVASRPAFWRALPKGISAGTKITDAKYNEIMSDIRKSKFYDLGQSFGKLDITDIKHVASAEEPFASRIAQAPIFKQSNMAYSANANALRQGLFDDMAEKAIKLGRDLDPNSKTFDKKLVRQMGDYINAATGRGDLGSFERYARVLNATLFSPRLVASRVNLMKRAFLDPLKAPANVALKMAGKTEYERMDPLIRREFWNDAFNYGGIQLGIMAAAKEAQKYGANVKVGDEPTSSEAGKLIFDNARVDFSGGMQPYFRLIAQIAQQAQTSSISGKRTELEEGFRAESTLDLIEKMVASKEAPLASLITNFLRGEDLTGQGVTMSSETVSRLTPIILQDIVSILRDDPNLLPLIVPANFGAGLQVYGPNDIKRQPRASEFEVTIPPIRMPRFGQ